jgi:hypothetical protein
MPFFETALRAIRDRESGEYVELRSPAFAFTVRQARQLLSGRGHFAGVVAMFAIDAHR